MKTHYSLGAFLCLVLFPQLLVAQLSLSVHGRYGYFDWGVVDDGLLTGGGLRAELENQFGQHVVSVALNFYTQNEAYIDIEAQPNPQRNLDPVTFYSTGDMRFYHAGIGYKGYYFGDTESDFNLYGLLEIGLVGYGSTANLENFDPQFYEPEIENGTRFRRNYFSLLGGSGGEVRLGSVYAYLNIWFGGGLPQPEFETQVNYLCDVGLRVPIN